MSSPSVAYINIEAADLLKICFAELGKCEKYSEALEIALRGTLPKGIIQNIEQKATSSDPKGLDDRFPRGARIHVDSWSELLNLGSLAYFYNSLRLLNAHVFASIGIEAAYRESSLRERFLGDGAISSTELNGRQIVQSCLAQNIRGKSAGKSLQQEVITRLETKLRSSPSEPERILAVTILSETEDFDELDFTEIAQATVGRYLGETTYGPVYCIMLSVAEDGPQVVVVPLIDFLYGSSRVAIIKSEYFM